MNQSQIDTVKRQNEERKRGAFVAANEAIFNARAELDNIEEQLEAAFGGNEYESVGGIYGVDAQAVFNAFAAVQSDDAFDKWVAENDEPKD